MYEWRTRTILAAAFLMGCTGEIQAPGSGPGSGPNGSGSNGSGSNGTGANGTGANGTGANGTGATGTGGGSGSTGTGGGSGGDPTVCVPGVPATSQLPRLTHVQYDNTIRDLVGLDSQPSTMLAPDTTGSVDQRAWDGYKAAADAVSTQVMATPAARSRAIPCTSADQACAQQLVDSLGKRAFRRPLTPEETTRFMAIFTNRAQVTATGTFDEAAQLIIRSFLLSPSFLTRAETAATPEGDKFALSGYEVASRLSYMLWSSMPDDALFAAAEANELQNKAQILAQAQRMIQDPKARAMVNAFHQSYAKMGTATRWDTIQRDPILYPSFSQAMVPMLSEETSRFFDEIVFTQNGTFKDLMTSTVGFVNSTLAPLYGLSAASYGTELTRVDLPQAQRPGVFTRAGFLTAYALFNRPSAILRGAFIQKQVLCTAIGSPPPDAESTPLPTDGLLTNRERTDAQTAGDACAGCHHGIINPTGFAMEAFDAIGAWQTAEKDTNAPINTVSTIPMDNAEVDVTGPADLMNALANSPAAQHCYAQRWVQFAYERDINPSDSCTVDNLATSLTQSGYTVLNLVADLTQSDSFRLRVQEQ